MHDMDSLLFCSFPLLFAFVVGGLGFELCVFVAGWRHALRSEWPFIIIIINTSTVLESLYGVSACLGINPDSETVVFTNSRLHEPPSPCTMSTKSMPLV